MKKITTLLLAFIAFLSCFSQVEVYKTLKDYQNNTPEKYTSTTVKFYADYRSSFSYKPILEFKEDGKKVKIMLSEAWGFKYKGILFRTITTMGNITIGLLSEGKICYWENAVFIFKKIDHITPGLTNAYYGYASYLSKNIESAIVTYDFRVLLNSNNEYNTLVDCVETKFIEEYNYTEKEMKRLDKLNNIGGTDGVALINYLSRYNYDKELNILRKCIKNFNGNFNSQILIEK